MQSKSQSGKGLQYWPGLFLLHVFAWLPIVVANSVARASAWSMWVFNSRLRQVTEKNLEICFPEQSCEQRRALAKKSLYELSSGVIDLARSWLRSGPELESRISKVTGVEHLDAAVAAGSGTLVLLPHLGSWEIVSQYLSQQYKFTALYRPLKTPVFSDFVRARRERHGARLMPIGTAGLRAVLQVLRADGMSVLFPDQVPSCESGEFAPFFGEPTLTMTLATKLLHCSGAKAVCAYCKRLPGGRYEMVFKPVDEAIYDSDFGASLAGLNRSIEACVLECPEQYQWEYKRFKYMPDQNKRDYHADELREQGLPDRNQA